MTAGIDLVVVGAGMAGLVAARRAAELGLRVVVLEQGEDEGYECNTRVSGGVLVVAGRPASTPADELEAALPVVTRGSIDPELARLLAHRAGPVVEWLRAQGAELVEQELQGRYRFTEVLAPTGLTTTGVEGPGRGPDVLLRRLVAAIEADGGEVRRAHRAERLLVEDGRVVGVAALVAGAAVEIRAAATLLADGGFQADPELVARHIAPAADRVVRRAAATSQGWGLRAAADLGADLVHLDSFYGHLLSIDALHDDRLWPYPVLDALAEAGVLVDRNGARFVDESLGGVHLANVLARRDDPLAYVVCDDAAWSGGPAHSAFPPPANPNLETLGATIHRADTLAELERLADLPAGSLAATGLAATTSGRPLFRAIPVVPGISFTMGGPRIDASARVLHRSGAPIPGLYAAGSCAGGFEGGAEVGYAGGLVRAAVTGVAAAEHLHGSSDRGPVQTSSIGGRA